MSGSITIRDLADAIDGCLLKDRRRFRRRLRRLKGRHDAKARQNGLLKLKQGIDASMKAVDGRRQHVVKQEFRGDLPILENRSHLSKVIEDNQVVIVCGETGSGKTTQLPRICIDLGRGVFGLIGHTQPRRLAARSVAQRISEEMGSREAVGCQVRFRRDVSEDAVIKVMTDGILLSELADDPRLESYDTIIIDEAHERSLNIDLLLGCLKQIIQRRPEFRVIVTSATIDARQFSEFFDGAPVIEVSGRQYPVEIIHAETGDSPEDPDSVTSRVRTAVDQALECHPDEGDMLVFLPGEREIREVLKSLEGPFGSSFDIIPLYARLSLAAQQKALKPGKKRRIVLSTNVAETSLTVPGVHVVIDSGLVRLSRFSARRGIDRLPIEGVSIASANQRAGRAGRIAPGTCIRLYSKGALERRDDYTAPEIMRTNLSSLILRLADLGLGSIDEFPLLDRPKPAAVRAGHDTLFELGAMDAHGAMTTLGRSMARLPVNPRVARMLLAAQEEKCLRDVLIIASALAIPHPGIRPAGEEEVADQRHAAFKVEGSDFLSLRLLWQSWVSMIREGGSHRRWCTKNYLSWVRMREWREIHDQLHRMLRESGIHIPDRAGDESAIHRALLTGLVTNIGTLSRASADQGDRKPEKGVYEGPDRRRFRIHPSSGQSRSRPAWLMSAEIVETNRLWARTVAGIDPAWIPSAASHLLEPVHGDARWDESRGAAVATEHRVLRGLQIPGTRTVPFAAIDPWVARRMFIDEGLVCGNIIDDCEVIESNRRLEADIERREARLRRRDLLVSEQDRAAFYESRLPEYIVDLASFKAWLISASEKDIDRLRMTEQDLLRKQAEVVGDAFPDQLDVSGTMCDVRYGFEPGADEDGLCVIVPLALLPSLQFDCLDWLVPGMLDEKIESIIRGLGKDVRRACQPVSGTVADCRHLMSERSGSFSESLAKALARCTGLDINAGMIEDVELPLHMDAVVEVVEGDRVVGRSRNITSLLKAHAQSGVEGFERAAATDEACTRGHRSWSFGGLLDKRTLQVGGFPVEGWVALVDEFDAVGTRVVASEADAVSRTRRGLCRLFLLNTDGSLEFQIEHLPGLEQMALEASMFMAGDVLRDGLGVLACESIFIGDGGVRSVRSASDFENRLGEGMGRISEGVLEVGTLCQSLLNKRQELAIVIESGAPAGCESIWESESAHLQRLFPRDVLHETPLGWLLQYPRWLDLSHARLIRAGQSASGIREAESIVRWEAALAEVWEDDRTAPAVRQMGWLLEEWRVRTYSSPKDQVVKVTAEMLRDQWSRVKRNT